MHVDEEEQASRRSELARWVAAQGGHAAVVRAFGLKPSQASYLSQLVNGYSFGARAARNLERRFGLPVRYFDRSLDSPLAQPPHPVEAREAPPPFANAFVRNVPVTPSQALDVIGQAIRLLPAARRAELSVAMQQWCLFGGAEHWRRVVSELLTAS